MQFSQPGGMVGRACDERRACQSDRGQHDDSWVVVGARGGKGVAVCEEGLLGLSPLLGHEPEAG